MHDVRISRQAKTDLEEIQQRGLTEFGALSTRHFMSGFVEIFERLQTYPLIGKPRPEYGRTIRSCLHTPYLVLYRYGADVVSIERILHTARRTQPLGEGKR